MSMAALSIDYVDERTNHQLHLPISVFKKPKNSGDYSRLEKILDQLMDEVRGDEMHPLALAMQIIGDNLEQYESSKPTASLRPAPLRTQHATFMALRSSPHKAE